MALQSVRPTVNRTLAGKATLTDQEAAEYATRKIERENKDSRDGSGTDADVGKAYNDAWWDFGTRASNQTSLVLDPPKAKLPVLTAEGQKERWLGPPPS